MGAHFDYVFCVEILTEPFLVSPGAVANRTSLSSVVWQMMSASLLLHKMLTAPKMRRRERERPVSWDLGEKEGTMLLRRFVY